MKALLAAILLLCAVAAVALLWRRRVPLPTGDLQAGMVELAEEAVRMAKKESGGTLDYSIESVQQVEAVLGALHERHSKESLPLEHRRYMAVRYGAYVGEVIRRHWGGHWEQDHPVGGPGSLPITSQGHQSFPTAWCFKRILNGAEDNVWHKLQILYVQKAADPAAQDTTSGAK